MKGATIPAKTGLTDAIIGFLRGALKKGIFDALLVPVRVPGGDSFLSLIHI